MLSTQQSRIDEGAENTQERNNTPRSISRCDTRSQG